MTGADTGGQVEVDSVPQPRTYVVSTRGATAVAPAVLDIEGDKVGGTATLMYAVDKRRARASTA